MRCYDTSYIRWIPSDLADRAVVHIFRFNMICCISHLVLGLLILPFDDLKARFFAPILAAIFCGLRKAIIPCLCCQNLRETFEKWLGEQELTVAEREEGEGKEKKEAGKMKMAEDEEREEGEMKILVDAGKVSEEDEISNGRIELTGELVEEFS